LSTRETEVLSLLSRGLSNKEIADQMRLSVETVRSYLKPSREIACALPHEAVIRYNANARLSINIVLEVSRKPREDPRF